MIKKTILTILIIALLIGGIGISARADDYKNITITHDGKDQKINSELEYINFMNNIKDPKTATFKQNGIQTKDFEYNNYLKNFKATTDNKKISKIIFNNDKTREIILKEGKQENINYYYEKNKNNLKDQRTIDAFTNNEKLKTKLTEDVIANPKEFLNNKEALNILFADKTKTKDFVKNLKNDKSVSSSQIITTLGANIVNVNTEDIFPKTKSIEEQKENQKEYNDAVLTQIVNGNIKEINDKNINAIKLATGDNTITTTTKKKDLLQITRENILKKDTMSENLKESLFGKNNPNAETNIKEAFKLNQITINDKNDKKPQKQYPQYLRELPEATNVYLSMEPNQLGFETINEKGKMFLLNDFEIDESSTTELTKLAMAVGDKDTAKLLVKKIKGIGYIEKLRRQQINVIINKNKEKYEILANGYKKCIGESVEWCRKLYNKECTNGKTNENCKKIWNTIHGGATYTSNISAKNQELMTETINTITQGIDKLPPAYKQELTKRCIDGLNNNCRKYLNELKDSKKLTSEQKRRIRAGILQAEKHQKVELSNIAKIGQFFWNPDQKGIQAFNTIFKKSPSLMRADEPFIQKWLDFEPVSLICENKVKGYLDLNAGMFSGDKKYENKQHNANDMSTTIYGCRKGIEQNDKSVEKCTQILVDLRAQSTNITPDKKVYLTYSYYLNAQGLKNQSYDLIFEYKDGTTKKEIFLADSKLYIPKDKDTISEAVRQTLELDTKDYKKIDTNSFKFKVETSYDLKKETKVFIMG